MALEVSMEMWIKALYWGIFFLGAVILPFAGWVCGERGHAGVGVVLHLVSLGFLGAVTAADFHMDSTFGMVVDIILLVWVGYETVRLLDVYMNGDERG